MTLLEFIEHEYLLMHSSLKVSWVEVLTLTISLQNLDSRMFFLAILIYISWYTSDYRFVV